MPAPTTRFALVILVALSAAACGADPAPDGDDVSSPAPEPTSPAPTSEDPAATDAEPADDPAPVVAEVLDFEAPLLDGGTLRGASLAGRDVAFWFWAPW